MVKTSCTCKYAAAAQMQIAIDKLIDRKRRDRNKKQILGSRIKTKSKSSKDLVLLAFFYINIHCISIQMD